MTKIRWFCGICGTELIYVRDSWICPQCGEHKDTKKEDICNSYVEGFKDGYNRAHDDMVEGIKR